MIDHTRNVVLIFMLLFTVASAADERPNIVLIIGDDIGFSDIGAFGSEIRTPNLDSLANEGVKLTNFHAAPTCGPTRSMLLTGVDHHLAGAGINRAGLFRVTELQGRPGYEGYLNDSVVTFVQLLNDAGYHTYATGKWDPGNRPGQLPGDHGFDRSFVMAAGGASHFDDMAGTTRPVPVAPYFEDGKRVENLPKDFFSSEFYTDRIIDYIESNDDERPFLAYLSFTAAHWPLQVPDEWLDRYADEYEEGWQAVREARFSRQKDLGVIAAHAELSPGHPQVQDWDTLLPAQRQVELKRMRIYAAMIENMDHHIGRLLSALDERVTDRETVIIFMSDNGAEGNAIDGILDNSYWIPSHFDNRLENLGRRGSYMWLGLGWGDAAVSPFTLFKSYTTAGGLRTPAIIHSSSGRFNRGMKDAVVTVRDIGPTLLELADVEQHDGRYKGRTVHRMSGKSLVDYLNGERDTVHGNEPLGWELYASRALIKGEWKAVRIFPPAGSGEWQLFNLKTDPTENYDLAGDYPKVMAELIADWDAYAKANGVAVYERDLGYGRY
ncbi:MAG: arylsulfatase [Woeseiaceae bacterium]|nr:arylsulfatase [Woeseiaceae bacterium]